MRDQVLCELSGLLHEYCRRSIDERELADRLETLASAVRGGPQLRLVTNEGESIVQPAEPVRDTSAQAVQRVFEYWQKRTGKTGARLLAERATKIRARLRTFTEAELCDAVDGAMLSEFLVEGNYLDIMTLFKNGAVVEGHIERKRGEGTPVEMPDGVKRLQERMEQARRDGDVQAYNSLNRMLKDELRART